MVIGTIIAWKLPSWERRVLKGLAGHHEIARESDRPTGITASNEGLTGLASRFTVTVGRVFMDDLGSTRLVGRLFNGNTTPAGAALKMTSYDTSGAIVDVKDRVWAASIHNIDPGTSYLFEAIVSDRPGVSRVILEVVDARTW